jgi:hypothetical protein
MVERQQQQYQGKVFKIVKLNNFNSQTNIVNRNINSRKSDGKSKSKTVRSTAKEHLIEFSEMLYKSLPEECWMTESTMATLFGVSRRQVRNAKKYLESIGKIVIIPRKNGARKNPKHYILKIRKARTRSKTIAPQNEIRWEALEGITLREVRALDIRGQLDLFEAMNMPFIPVHFPFFEDHDVPVCSCRKGSDCPYIGKHPVVRFKNLDFSRKATFSKMKQFWVRGDGSFNVGILTDGFCVLDVDLRNGGAYSFEHIEEIYGEFPRNLMVSTGSGFHIYGLSRTHSAVEALGFPGIDIRSAGGYVIAPHSRHRNGSYYQWASTYAPEPLPAEFVSELISTRKTEATIASNLNECQIREGQRRILAGQRNKTLFRRACGLRGNGKPFEEILTRISDLNNTLCDPPLESSEIYSIARSAAAYAPNRSLGLER